MNGPADASYIQGPNNNSPIIHRLPTSVWWAIAKDLSTKNLSRLRLVSRRIEHELYQPYLERRFTSITINATAQQKRKHALQERDPEGTNAVVRSLTLIGHLKAVEHRSRCPECNGGRITRAEWENHFRHHHVPLHKSAPPVLTQIAIGYAPLASIASFANLHKLKICGVSTEWLEGYFPITDLANVVSKQSIKMKELELNDINLDIKDLAKLLAAFNGSLEKLSLRFELYQGESRMTGKWVDLFRALESLKLRALDFVFQHGGTRWPNGPGRALYDEPSLPHCNRWLGKKETYVLRACTFTATGRLAVDAGLQRVIQWFELEYPQH
ncbi:hypothetical protein LTR56_019725 [Elasticomyces elasticus]|nr:hypothetical protein LTR56_019725 [Elasticomyces elasticus]KAK3655590.1 hypothetical protein LTR22_010180 [Elasticomyces elasticus]KAK4925867.1 hypothetical protein LTR49_007244 [Elasticomyces elasticus]KAK5764822.1 hypothetical protein LTS12_005092 [Elasticomyces elasticus]